MDDAATTAMATTDWMGRAHAVLAERFGHDAFRPGQAEVIGDLLDGRDVVAVMPTGSGKSLCYQLPALMLGGLTLVVSPLIALMKDQVDGLSERGIAATCINSTLSPGEQQRRLDAACRGRVRLLFVAPERFQVDGFLEQLLGPARPDISLLAVDEAHCISQWGHDFRPDYRRLGEVRRRLGAPRTVALTATATPAVRDDIAQQLDLETPAVHVFGFERPNLHLEVQRCDDRAAKLEIVSSLLDADTAHDDVADGPAIIYCATRRDVELVAHQLARRGHEVGVYHAGLRDADRHAIQNAFMGGELGCLVATMAFGMGVDKADIRRVVHMSLPRSLEAYYQEVGRAGRDGAPARCVLLYNYADTGVHDFFIRNSHPERDIVEGTWQVLMAYGGATGRLVEVGTRGIIERLDLRTARGRRRRVHPMAVGQALHLLQEAGHIEPLARSGWMVVDPPPGGTADVRSLRVDHDAIARRADTELSRLKRMVFYATTARCRTHDILRYFGSPGAHRHGHCNHCDNCTAANDDTSCAEPEPLVFTKVLSGIARLQGDHGAETAVAVLCGQATETIVAHDLHRLSTWGLLADRGRREVRRLVRLALRRGFALVDPHGHIRLTRLGWTTMTAERRPTRARRG